MVIVPAGEKYPINWPTIQLQDDSLPPQIPDTFFYFDGTKVIGPHAGREVSELFHADILKPETQICTANNHQWKKLQEFPELIKERPKGSRRVVADDENESDQEVGPGADAPADVTMHRPDRNTANRSDGVDVEKRLTPIKKIRFLLDGLWEAQRESIIANIKNEELDDFYEVKRRGHLEIKEKIKELVMDYWRKAGVLDEWINDLISEGKNGEWGDYEKKFKTGDVNGNFERTLAWLDESELGQKAGVYSFEKGSHRIYVGESDNLARRLRQHQGYFAWGEATQIRILIPRRKSNRDKLERMVILRHLPSDNGNEGISIAGSKADEILDFILEEINELLTDG